VITCDHNLRLQLYLAKKHSKFSTSIYTLHLDA
jgi:hypothetical protein